MKTLLPKSVLALAAVLGSVGVASAQDWKLGVKISAASGGGVYVHEVFSGSPAEMAGILPGDTILTADGVLYNDPFQFRNVVMSGTNPSIDLIVTDGTQFYQVLADFQVITTAVQAYDGSQVQKQQLKMKKVTRKVVADPRKGGAKPPVVNTQPPSPKPVRKIVRDPRK